MVETPMVRRCVEVFCSIEEGLASVFGPKFREDGDGAGAKTAGEREKG
jgi:hypothetical protein